jgi:hypothetical protein
MANNPEAGTDGQLRLDLDEVTQSSAPSTVVINFIDAATRALRREALERIKNTGIFEPPDLHHLR